MFAVGKLLRVIEKRLEQATLVDRRREREARLA